MKRQEFIQAFVNLRRDRYKAATDAGEMRVSEAVMGLGQATLDAAKLWRKHRKDYVRMTAQELFK